LEESPQPAAPIGSEIPEPVESAWPVLSLLVKKEDAMEKNCFRRFWIVMVCLVGAFILLESKALAADDKDKPKEVVCKGLKFLVEGKEQPLTIRVGESVVWVNQDKAKHDATSKEDSEAKFDAVEIPKEGKSKPVKFTKAGTYKYYCTIHDDMEGTIIVKE
jgi:plastocyanin